MMLFSATVVWANAQRGHHHNYHCGPPRHYGYPVVAGTPFFGGNYYNQRPFLSVVIAPRPRVEAVIPVAPPPQPRLVREWVEGHWEEGAYGRVWVEGHYVQREVY